VLPDHHTSGVHHYLGSPTLSPGESVVATITFMTPEEYPHSLDAGDVIEISEGSRVVGRARILRVLNPLLQRAAGPSATDGGDGSALANPLPESWFAVDAKMSDTLVAELHRELPSGHTLFGHRVRAIARSGPQDDVLFESLEGNRDVFVVHLTWRPETDPTWPFTTRFDSINEFFRKWPREELDG
jgi:hypothetical protein